MQKFYVLIFFFSLTATSISAQTQRYTVRFKYKAAQQYSLSQPSAFLSAKAIARRQKQRIIIDSTDLPVNHDFINTVSNVPGVSLLSISKWLNHVLIETSDPAAIQTINTLSFVHQVNTVAYRPSGKKAFPAMASIETGPDNKVISPAAPQHITSDTINYGNNYPQVHIHEGEYLHNLGFRGQGMTIAVLDAGFFKYLTNPAFDSIRNNNQVLGTYDFVKKEDSVNEDNVHGANCLSIMAANRPGVIVGTAPKATYWLYRTEDAGSEKPVEEYNWIEAAERADSAGVDMISSSLGYVNFDDAMYNHPYSQRDGNTTLITVAADLAVKKGMIVMNSAGNSGNATNDTKYIMCPADGDSVMTVGAVNSSGVIGGFSSWGPNAAGKIKPNIVSVGWGAVYANTIGNAATGNGTSYSNPNIAGLIACLWQAFPEFSNMDILDAVQKSADRFLAPTERYGYGIPNFRIAHNLLQAKRDERTNNILSGKWIKAFPVPFKQVFSVFLKAPATGNARLRLFDMTGRLLLEKSMQVNQGSSYNIRMNPASVQRYGVYYLQYSDGKNNSTLKLISL